MEKVFLIDLNNHSTTTHHMTKNWIEELGKGLVDFIQVKDSANIDYFIELVNHECLSDDTNTLIKINRKLKEF